MKRTPDPGSPDQRRSSTRTTFCCIYNKTLWSPDQRFVAGERGSEVSLPEGAGESSSALATFTILVTGGWAISLLPSPRGEGLGVTALPRPPAGETSSIHSEKMQNDNDNHHDTDNIEDGFIHR